MSIAVTGLGIICAIGNDTTSVLRSLREKKSGVGQMQYLQSVHKELPVGEVKLSDDDMKQMLGIPADHVVSRTSLMGAIAIRQALTDSGANIDGKRVVVISGTTVGGMDITERYFQQLKTDDSLLHLIEKHNCGSQTQEMTDIALASFSMKPAKIDVCTISTACSSAVNSIIIGCEMLKADEADIVIAGGAESLSCFHLNGFNTLMILDHEQCRPFDKTRTGLNLGEGAGFVVLSPQPSNEGAVIAGYGNRCDAFHQTASSEDGEGAYLAMTDALAMAGLQPKDIDYVNAHGTGTPNNDPSESTALKRVFGEQMPPMSSTKGFTGHTTSASGSIETVISILAMQNNFIPANLGWKEADEACITPTTGADDITINNIVCNSFGFGGNDSSVIISRQMPEATHIASSLQGGQGESLVLADETIDDPEQLKDFREFISPMEARRMGKLLKAATLTSLRALHKAGVECPDAIITATANGMLDTTEKFLEDIYANGEETLSPTLFMQSTHNTLGSAIAIRTKCHGYNITYSQDKDSFEWAMRDAERLIRTGKAKSVLVVNADEATPLLQSFYERLGKPVPKAIYSRSIVLVHSS